MVMVIGAADDWALAVAALGKLTGKLSERFKNKVDMMKNVKMAKMTSIIGTIFI
jgi:inosine/xanthosine triphosphate pyrophosphatase family protein